MNFYGIMHEFWCKNDKIKCSVCKCVKKIKCKFLSWWYIKRTPNQSGNPSKIPVQDQQMALCLLLELSIQRGSLSHILSSVLLLLNLWNNSCQESDNRMSSGLNSAPLIHMLQRFQAIKGSKSRVYSEQKKLEEVDIWLHMIFFSLKAFQFLYIFRGKKWLLRTFICICFPNAFCCVLSSLLFLPLSFSLNIDFIPKKSKWSKISKSSMKVHKVFGLKNHTFSLGVNFHCLINNTCSCKSEFLMGDVNSKEHLLFKISKNWSPTNINDCTVFDGLKLLCFTMVLFDSDSLRCR